VVKLLHIIWNGCPVNTTWDSSGWIVPKPRTAALPVLEI